MKHLDSRRLVIPQGRVMVFEAIIQLARRRYGTEWAEKSDVDWLRTYKQGGKYYRRHLEKAGRKYKLKSTVVKTPVTLGPEQARLWEDYRKVRRNFIDLATAGTLRGSIEVAYCRARCLGPNLAHLLYSQLHTVCSTGYVGLLVGQDIVYGLVTFLQSDLNKVLAKEVKQRQITQGDREAMITFRKKMEEYVDKNCPPGRVRPILTEGDWLDYEDEVSKQLGSKTLERPSSLSSHQYQQLIAEIFGPSTLTADRGRRSKEQKAGAKEVFEHFFGKIGSSQEDEDEENA